MPQIPADFSKDCTDFSLKDLSKPLCPLHEYSTDFVKGTSSLVSNIGDAELKIDASDQGKLEVMQQDLREMEIVDEVVEIEKAAYQNYKAEVKNITLEASYSQLHVACQSSVLLSTPTFQDINFVISEEFNRSIELVGVKLSSLLPQTKKQKEIRIQSVYSMSKMHFKKPRFFLLQHFKTRGRVFSNQGRMMQEAVRRQISYILFDFMYQEQFCNFLIF